MPTTQNRSATSPVLAEQLDRESRAWLEALRADRPRREAAIRRLHSPLLCEARHEVGRRTAGLEHPWGRDLDDLAQQAADDALVAILGLFTTWARRFAQLEVPGKIRRRLGHARETPTDSDLWQTRISAGEEPQASVEASDFARTLRDLIDHQLAVRKLRDVDELIQRANAVRRWLEMTSACECESLDVCSLFDDRVLGLDAQIASARSPSVLVIAPGR